MGWFGKSDNEKLAESLQAHSDWVDEVCAESDRFFYELERKDREREWLEWIEDKIYDHRISRYRHPGNAKDFGFMLIKDLSALSKELNIKEPIEATKRTIGEKIVKSISKDELLVFAKKNKLDKEGFCKLDGSKENISKLDIVLYLAEGAGKRLQREEMQQECNQIRSYLQVNNINRDRFYDDICNNIVGKSIRSIEAKLVRYKVLDSNELKDRYSNISNSADYRKDLIKRLLPFLVAKYQKEAKEADTLAWLVFGAPLLLFLIINWYFG